jgi:hypothetical protein
VHVPFQSDPADAETSGDDGEVVDAVPVLAGAPGALDSRGAGERLPEERRAVIPAVQAAAVAAGGFVAGAAVVGLVHRHTRRSNALVKGSRRGARRVGRGRAGELAQVVGSRSFLVDVHLLGGDR